MSEDLVSVVIPTYNRADTIIDSVNSVLKQTYKNIEIIIVDDCSTDNTSEAVKQLLSDSVKYVKRSQNGGAGAARNTGAENANGKWIAFLDSDDCWHIDKIYKQVEYAKMHPEYDLIYCGYRGYYDDGKVTSTPNRSLGQMLEGDIFSSILFRNVIGAPTVLIKREVFLNEKGFDEELRCLEDWEFALNIAKNHKIGFVDEDLLDAAIHVGGVSTNVSEYFKARCYIAGKYRDSFIEHNLLNAQLEDIIKRAYEIGVADYVEKLLSIYLAM